MIGFDIFCRVIDHFGDAGIAWRLGKQLKQLVPTAPVRLWVDDLPTLARIVPNLHPLRSCQSINQVTICQWKEAVAEAEAETGTGAEAGTETKAKSRTGAKTHCTGAPGVNVAPYPAWPTPYPVVIEAFAGGLPAAIRQQLGLQHLWLVLDHLSAEPWVDSIHKRANSPQPHPEQYFFYAPGFTPHTGGLLRENGLLSQWSRWQQLPKALQWQQLQHSLGLSTAMLQRLAMPDNRSYFIFQYPDAPVPELLHYLAQLSSPSVVFLAADQPWAHLQDSLPASSPVLIHQLPFISHRNFDRLLWSTDMNFVRGEDSWIRALWAQKPFIWQPYPQAERTHHLKLEAWLQQTKLPFAAQQLQRHWVNSADRRRYLNPGLAKTRLPALHRSPAMNFQALHPAEQAAWGQALRAQVHRLSHQPDLARQLIDFCRRQLAQRSAILPMT